MRRHLRAGIGLCLAAGLLLSTSAFGQRTDELRSDAVQTSQRAEKRSSLDLAKLSEAIVERTNEFRKSEGKSPATMNETLRKTAESFAQYMAKTNRYGHTADGNQPSQRAANQGYEYCIVSENIAYQFDSTGFTGDELVKKFVTGWKESPGHRKNMLDGDVTETGVGIARSDETGYYYAVQMFARPKSAAIDFAVENRSKKTIEYTVGEERFSLPPRAIRRHTRCRSGEISFPFSDRKDLRPNDDQRYTIVDGPQGPMLQNR